MTKRRAAMPKRRVTRGGAGLALAVSALVSLALAGCQVTVKETQGRTELEYTVLDEDEIPEQLRPVIEKKRAEPFAATLEEEGKLYIARGYGEQPTDGYTIQVEQCASAGGVVYLRTALIGPGYDQEIREAPSCPYLVIETEQSGNYVVFE